MIQLVKEFDLLGVTIRFLGDEISTEGTMGRLLLKFTVGWRPKLKASLRTELQTKQLTRSEVSQRGHGY